MSTRSEILISEFWVDEKGKKHKETVKLYHHHDGYPEGVGRFLMDEVYPMLQTSNRNDNCDIANFLIKHKEDDEFELTTSRHVDIEYQYHINVSAKTIRCFAGHYNYEYDSDKTPRFVKRKECDLKQFLPQNPKALYK